MFMFRHIIRVDAMSVSVCRVAEQDGRSLNAESALDLRNAVDCRERDLDAS